MYLIINSNTCVGSEVYKLLNLEYNSPLIGTLIVDDMDYIYLIKNFKKIITYDFVCNTIPKIDSIFEKQTSYKYYNHKSINIPYPIININNIDIHCIHENNIDICLEKFKRRLNRCNNIIKENQEYKIINIMVFSEIINIYDDYNLVIKNFLSNQDNNTINIFLGPEKYYIETDLKKYNIYIVHSNFNNINTNKRDESNIMIGNNQDVSSEIIKNFIINNKLFK
mgnify:FL=1